MCNLFDIKQSIINQLISNRFANEATDFKINISNFISSRDKIALLEKDFPSIPPIEI